MADNKVPELTPEAIAQRRVANCQKEITGILAKYNCVLDASMTISLSGVEPIIKILALRDEVAPEKIPMPQAEVTPTPDPVLPESPKNADKVN